MFSEYARNALRMAALMKQRQIFVFTHDSIGLGEDGPTHQPVEQTATLRLIPNMDVWRPCDTTESAVAWASPIERRTARRACASRARTCPSRRARPRRSPTIRRGGYVLSEAGTPVPVSPQAMLIATGSEVALAMAAQQAARRRRHRRARGVHAQRPTSSTARTPRTSASVLPRACRASPSRPAAATAGTSTSGSKAP
jgi:transketolase